MDIKDAIRDVVRTELADMLPGLLAQARADEVSSAATFQTFLAEAEGRLQNLINSTEVRVSQHLAAAAMLKDTK